AMNFSLFTSEDPNRFLPLVIVLLLAFVVPILLSRFRRVPVVVGEIVAGILVGPAVLGLVTETPILVFMQDIGLAFLMFLAGMEINLDQLLPARNGQSKSQEPRVASSALVVYALTLGLALVAGYLVVRQGAGGDPLLLAFVFSATSLGVVLPTLKERGMLSTRFGQFVLVSATLADFITIILLTIYIITFDRGFDLEVLSLGLLFVAFLIFYRIGPAFVRRPRVRKFFDDLSHATVQIKVRGAILVLMLFVVLAEFVDAELILGAFLAGLIVSLLKGPEDESLVEKLEAFGFGFFIPVFFIMVGVDLDLAAAFDAPARLVVVAVLFAVATIVKIVPVLIVGRSFSLRERLAGGVLLNTHLSLEVAIAVIGLRTGLLDAATSTFIVLFALLTVLAMPLIFNLLAPVVEHVRSRFMLAIGVTDLSLAVAQELRAHGDTVRFVEQQPALAERATGAGFEVLNSAGTTDELRDLGIADTDSVLLLGEHDDMNLELARAVRQCCDSNLVAYVSDPQYLADYERLGVQPFMGAMYRATIIAMLARNPDAFRLLTSTDDERNVFEVNLENRALFGVLLRHMRLPGDYLVLSIRRRGELIVPHGNTVLQYGDRLTILGSNDRLREVREWLEGRTAHLDTHI
ncbi:MAG: cation:proton antiporter, partial [Anaerolineae bacterium]|nr:cation:proton antiporter [Anaerolineae bacterium]